MQQYDKRLRIINHYLYQNACSQPDIFTFQETHSTAGVEPVWSTQFSRGAKLLWSHGTSASRGIVLGFKAKLQAKIVSHIADKDGHYVGANVKLHGQSFTIASIYLLPNSTLGEKLEILNSIMKAIGTFNNSRVIMCGDFNIVFE